MSLLACIAVFFVDVIKIELLAIICTLEESGLFCVHVLVFLRKFYKIVFKGYFYGIS